MYLKLKIIKYLFLLNVQSAQSVTPIFTSAKVPGGQGSHEAAPKPLTFLIILFEIVLIYYYNQDCIIYNQLHQENKSQEGKLRSQIMMLNQYYLLSFQVGMLYINLVFQFN